MVPPALDLCPHFFAPGSGQCLNALVSTGFHHCYVPVGVFSPLWPLWACRRHRFLEASWLLLLPDPYCRLCCGLPTDRALCPPGAFQRPIPLRVGWPGAAGGCQPLSLPARGGSLSCPARHNDLPADYPPGTDHHLSACSPDVLCPDYNDCPG